MKKPGSSSSTHIDQAGVLGLSPIEYRRKGSLLEYYQNKMGEIMQSSNLTFEKIETPGWSSLVESNISYNKKPTQKHDYILSRLISLNGKTYEEIEKTRTSRNPMSRPRSTTNIPRPIQQPAPVRQQPVRYSQPTAKKYNSRWREISVHYHLYLDSKKLETKRMVERIMEYYMRNETFKFKPTINPNSVFLAEQRFKKLYVDPTYRCGIRNNFKPVEKKQKYDLSELEFKCLHVLFHIMSGGTMTLRKEGLNTDQVPLPCLRSLEPILYDIFVGKSLSWIEFLEDFYSRATNRKAFFKVLIEWVKRNQLDIDF